jgi:hypothetical protein
VCMHHDTPGEEESTTAAMVAALLPGAPPHIWWCEGSPCVGEFRPVAA